MNFCVQMKNENNVSTNNTILNNSPSETIENLYDCLFGCDKHKKDKKNW